MEEEEDKGTGARACGSVMARDELLECIIIEKRPRKVSGLRNGSVSDLRASF